ncbi:MAG: hypothetical protein AABW50_05345 [Nanoarchaeota archaeon]
MPKRKRSKGKSAVRSKKGFFEKYLTLDWKEAYLILILWFLFIVLHNLINAIFRIQEEVLVVFYKWIIPVFFLIALLYTISKRKKV